MRKIFYVCIAAVALSMAACSSDSPGEIDDELNGGDSGDRIPQKELDGLWVLTRYYYEVEMDDIDFKKQMIDYFESDASSHAGYPKKGAAKFHPGMQWTMDLKFVEGLMDYTYSDKQLSSYADYYTKKDTIFYYQHHHQPPSSDGGVDYQAGRWHTYFIKKGNVLYYKKDNTLHHQQYSPNKGVKKIIFYAEYMRQ